MLTQQNIIWKGRCVGLGLGRLQNSIGPNGKVTEALTEKEFFLRPLV